MLWWWRHTVWVDAALRQQVHKSHGDHTNVNYTTKSKGHRHQKDSSFKRWTTPKYEHSLQALSTDLAWWQWACRYNLDTLDPVADGLGLGPPDGILRASNPDMFDLSGQALNVSVYNRPKGRKPEHFLSLFVLSHTHRDTHTCERQTERTVRSFPVHCCHQCSGEPA